MTGTTRNGTPLKKTHPERLGKHNLADIKLADNEVKKARTDFVFPAYEQVKMVADGVVRKNKRLCLDGAAICVWLMRGCGLRIEEALAVEKSDFIEDGTVLRVMWQAARRRARRSKRRSGNGRRSLTRWSCTVFTDAAAGI